VGAISVIFRERWEKTLNLKTADGQTSGWGQLVPHNYENGPGTQVDADKRQSFSKLPPRGGFTCSVSLGRPAKVFLGLVLSAVEMLNLSLTLA
jgi:hypothetical protein